MKSVMKLLNFLAISFLVLFSQNLMAEDYSKFEIDRIDIRGVNVFSSQIIENALEISPGDLLERLRVVRTEQNLQLLYNHKGYEEVRIQSRLIRKKTKKNLFETILEFEVTEGNPVRIASFKIISDGLSLSDNRIRKIIGIIPGDLYDLDKLSEQKRTVLEFLASEEFIGAKVDTIRKPAPGIPGEIASQWVEVELHVALGQRVNFGFRGNTAFTWGYLSNLVEEQRLVGLGKDYIGVVRARLQAEYRSAGYARVEITPYTIESPNHFFQKVTYSIQEGPRVKIDSIHFDGNSTFSDELLKQRFYARASSLVQNGIYAEKDVQKAFEMMIESIKEQGYLSAKLITVNAVYLPKASTQIANSALRLMVYIYEGEQTIIQGIEIQGCHALELQHLKNLLRAQEGDPLNLFHFGEGIEIVKKYYRDLGYLSFKILNEGTPTVIQYSQENRIAHIYLQFEEGLQYKVSRIELEGLVLTREQVVLRELLFREGHILTEPKLIETERAIRRLGIFSKVIIRPVDDPAVAGAKIVRITLKESDRGTLAWGPGIRNDLGGRLFGQFSYNNLWGLNHTISLSAAVNRRFNGYNFMEGQAQFLYTWPWFFVPELVFRPSVSLGQTQYINFAAAFLTASAAWERQLFAKPHLMGSMGYTFETINQFRAANGDPDQILKVGTITPRFSLDLRDSSLAPTSGIFVTSWLDLAGTFLGSTPDIGYYRFQFRSDYYISVTGNIGLFLSFRTGYEQSNANQNIPLIKQFTVGGIASLRGYQEQAFYANGALIGSSLSYVNYRTQIDLPFAGPLKFGLFVDAANLLVNNYSLGGLNYGTGFGFHYMTPVGPVNFDWGFKVDPPLGVDPYVIHFSVGII